MFMKKETELEDLILILKDRFLNNMHRHAQLDWKFIEEKIKLQPDKLNSLFLMEQSGGESDVIGYDKETNTYVFCDCSKESPKGRRSYCYDRDALDARKEHKPTNNAIDVARKVGIKLLNEEEYRMLQALEAVDTKTSSWIETPAIIRNLGGALFGDFRYNAVFIYHNGASSYYSSRGFRGILKI